MVVQEGALVVPMTDYTMMMAQMVMVREVRDIRVVREVRVFVVQVVVRMVVRVAVTLHEAKVLEIWLGTRALEWVYQIRQVSGPVFSNCCS